MGGEWGVGASLAMEKVPPRLRGVLSGLLQQGYATGNLLAAIAYFFLFQRWGWRPLFFLGGLPALLALFVRFRVKESEVWEKTREKPGADSAAQSPRTGSFLVPDLADDDDELRIAWHARHVPHFSGTPMALRAIRAFVVHRHFDDRCDRGEPYDRTCVRPLRPPSRDDHRSVGRNRDGAALGVRAIHCVAHIGRVSDPVHGAGLVGHHPRAFVGAFARTRSADSCPDLRISAGCWWPVRWFISKRCLRRP